MDMTKRPSYGHMAKRLFLLLGLAMVWSFFVAPVVLAAANHFVIDPATRHLVIENHIEYLLETTPLEVDQVASPAFDGQWQRSNKGLFSMNRPDSPLWLRFKIRNDNPNDWMYLLTIRQQSKQNIRVIQTLRELKASAITENGVFAALSETLSLKKDSTVFPLSLPTGELITVFIRLDSAQTMFLKIDLFEKNKFQQFERSTIFFTGLLFGVLVVMALYNFIIFFITWDRNYLVYSFYIVSVIFLELSLTRISEVCFLCKSEWLRQNGVLFFSSIVVLSALVFNRYFLAFRSYGGILLKINNVFIIYWSIFTLAITVVPPLLLIKLLSPTLIITLVTSLLVSIYLWIKGNVQAKYYTIASLILYAGTAIGQINLMGFLPRSIIAEYGHMVGFMVELVLLSMALADKIKRSRLAKEEAQKQALNLINIIREAKEEKLKAQEQLLEMERRTNEELEQKVADRTNELKLALESLEAVNVELSELSITDPLTRMHNRRYFDQIYAREFAAAAEKRLPITVAIADIDHFKPINDNFGHLVGDECLRLVATTMRQQIRQTCDFMARYGGEEFIFIFPGTPLDSGVQISDRARKAVEKINFIYRGQRVRLRVSVGVAGWIPQPADDPYKLIKAADDALYKAKETGRNQTIAADG